MIIGPVRLDMGGGPAAPPSAPAPAVLDYRGGPAQLPPAATRPRLGWALAAAPPLTALMAWPVLFAIFFVMAFTLGLMTVAGCLIWAWWVSGRLAGWWYWKRVDRVMREGGTALAPGFRMCLKAILFSLQAAAIIGSIPLFGMILQLTRRHEIRLGWW